jgi:hypothetical protein
VEVWQDSNCDVEGTYDPFVQLGEQYTYSSSHGIVGCFKGATFEFEQEISQVLICGANVQTFFVSLSLLSQKSCI